MAESYWIGWQGKKAHIILKNNYEYNCEIISVEATGNGIIFLNIIDKFGRKITFTTGEIALIEEKE